MKAIVIYESIASALKACSSLHNAAWRASARKPWRIELWRAGLMRFPSLAQQALDEARDADLVICAARQARVLSPWVKDWLEQWAVRRLVVDAALALVAEEPSGAESAEALRELFQFAGRHHLGVITGTAKEQNSNERPVVKALPKNFIPSPAWILAAAKHARRDNSGPVALRSPLSKNPQPNN